MKQLIIILSIMLCVTKGFSQTDPMFEQNYIKHGYVDLYKELNIPHDIGQEAFLGELDKYFRQSGVEKGYSSWQLYGYDYNRGTFFLVEFFKDNQPIGMGYGTQHSPEYIVYMLSESKKKK